MTSRPRRDFLLDSGGVSALARDRDVLSGYVEFVETRVDGALLIPVPVLTEVRTGHRGIDVLTDRLLKALGGEEALIGLSPAASMRAGVLRTEALDRTRRDISTTDAQLVATAEERSFGRAVTVVTGDPRDIELLVGLTRRPNIAVDVLS